MTTKQTCPVCELEQPDDREPLKYFAQSQPVWPRADHVSDLYEDTERVLNFLGAVAHAITEQDSDMDEEERQWLPWLAEELTKEAQRRLDRLRKAGLTWRQRACKA